jgi:hypothetical protein
LLMKPDASVPRGVSANVWRRHQTARLHILDWQPRLEHDDPRGRIICSHEHRRDHHVLARRERAQVDERCLQRIRRAQSAIIGLIDRPSAIGVGEQGPRLVEGVGVRVTERRRERERGWSALAAATMDPALEGAEADALTLERESFTKSRQRHEIVISLGKLPGSRDRSLPEWEIRIGGRHERNCAAATRATQRWYDYTATWMRPRVRAESSSSNAFAGSPLPGQRGAFLIAKDNRIRQHVVHGIRRRPKRPRRVAPST